MTPQEDARGYLHVRLRKDGAYKLFKVHVLVGICFLGYDPSQYDRKNIDTLVIDHLDGDKHNNDVGNLEVVSQRENIRRYCSKKNKK